MSDPALPNMVSVQTVANALELSDDAVRRLIYAGQLTARKIGSRYRIDVESVRRLCGYAPKRHAPDATTADLHRMRTIVAMEGWPLPPELGDLSPGHRR